MWKNHAEPQQPGTCSSCWSSARSHTAVGCHPILQPATVTSQPVWLCWSLWQNRPIQTDPTNVQRGWGQNCRQATLSSHSQILEVVSDKPHSWRTAFGSRLWRYGILTLTLVAESPMMTSLFFPVKLPHTRSGYPIGAAIIIAVSASSPHFDPNIQLP